MTILSSQYTHPGAVRPANEDALLFLPRTGLYAVADGMGDGATGYVAARGALDALTAHITSSQPWSGNQSPEYVRAVVVEGLHRASAAVRAVASRNPGLAGVRSTATAVVVVGRHLVWAHVGDSRLYRIANGRAECWTQDHTWAADLARAGAIEQQAVATHPYASVLVRALGQPDSLAVDSGVHALSGAETFVLCSDGLTEALSDEQLTSLVSTLDVRDAAGALVELANKRQAADNVSAIVLQSDAPVQELPRRNRLWDLWKPRRTRPSAA